MDIGGLATSAATTAVNAGIASMFSSRDRLDNFKLNEQAAENADRRARAQWEDMYSLSAQLRELKKAGLSPSLMYGGNGSQQGATGAQGGGGQGLQTMFAPMSATEIAEVSRIQAEARKLNVEADEIEGKNELGKQKILNWIKKNYGQDLANDYQNIVNYVADASKEYDINKRFAEAEIASQSAMKLVYETVKAQNEAEISEKTKDEIIKKATLENSKLIAQAFEQTELAKLHKKQRAYLQSQIEYFMEKAAREWAEIEIKKDTQKSYEDWVKNQDEYWDNVAKNLQDRLSHDVKYDWAKLSKAFQQDLIDNFVKIWCTVISSRK